MSNQTANNRSSNSSHSRRNNTSKSGTRSTHTGSTVTTSQSRRPPSKMEKPTKSSSSRQYRKPQSFSSSPTYTITQMVDMYIKNSADPNFYAAPGISYEQVPLIKSTSLMYKLIPQYPDSLSIEPTAPYIIGSRYAYKNADESVVELQKSKPILKSSSSKIKDKDRDSKSKNISKNNSDNINVSHPHGSTTTATAISTPSIDEANISANIDSGIIRPVLFENDLSLLDIFKSVGNTFPSYDIQANIVHLPSNHYLSFPASSYDIMASSSWYYRDITDTIQGPFPSLRMNTWFEYNQMKPDTPIGLSEDSLYPLHLWILSGRPAFLARKTFEAYYDFLLPHNSSIAALQSKAMNMKKASEAVETQLYDYQDDIEEDDEDVYYDEEDEDDYELDLLDVFEDDRLCMGSDKGSNPFDLSPMMQAFIATHLETFPSLNNSDEENGVDIDNNNSEDEDDERNNGKSSLSYAAAASSSADTPSSMSNLGGIDYSHMNPMQQAMLMQGYIPHMMDPMTMNQMNPMFAMAMNQMMDPMAMNQMMNPTATMAMNPMMMANMNPEMDINAMNPLGMMNPMQSMQPMQPMDHMQYHMSNIAAMHNMNLSNNTHTDINTMHSEDEEEEAEEEEEEEDELVQTLSEELHIQSTAPPKKINNDSLIQSNKDKQTIAVTDKAHTTTIKTADPHHITFPLVDDNAVWDKKSNKINATKSKSQPLSSKTSKTTSQPKATTSQAHSVNITNTPSTTPTTVKSSAGNVKAILPDTQNRDPVYISSISGPAAAVKSFAPEPSVVSAPTWVKPKSTTTTKTSLVHDLSQDPFPDALTHNAPQQYVGVAPAIIPSDSDSDTEDFKMQSKSVIKPIARAAAWGAVPKPVVKSFAEIQREEAEALRLATEERRLQEKKLEDERKAAEELAANAAPKTLAEILAAKRAAKVVTPMTTTSTEANKAAFPPVGVAPVSVSKTATPLASAVEVKEQKVAVVKAKDAKKQAKQSQQSSIPVDNDNLTKRDIARILGEPYVSSDDDDDGWQKAVGGRVKAPQPIQYSTSKKTKAASTQKSNTTKKSSHINVNTPTTTASVKEKKESSKKWSMSEAFTSWCRRELDKLTGSDDLSLIDFVMTITDENMIKETIEYNTGNKEFAQSFMEHRTFELGDNRKKK